MEPARSYGDGDFSSTLEHWVEGAGVLPAQMAESSNWSSEKKLAAAVLACGLCDVRDQHGSPRNRARALAWINSDEMIWPFSFLRLCELFDLDPDWVRQRVRCWILSASHRRRTRQRSCHLKTV